VTEAAAALLRDPLRNRGTAFTADERRAHGLDGALPPRVESLAEQVGRMVDDLERAPNDFARHRLLRDVQDENETLFYATLASDIARYLPLVYTPTVGEACQRFGEIYRRPRGLYLAPGDAARLETILGDASLARVRLIVVTDGERILGLGDLGTNGMGIPIGKLSLYVACAGIDPAMTLPVCLDVGTDNAELRASAAYLGSRVPRLRGAAYDAFVDAFIDAVGRTLPGAVVQFEDFGRANAQRLLERYRERIPSFNDDIQGTASVATGMLLAAFETSGERLADQRFAFLGAGSAGCGIAALIVSALREAGLSDREARGRMWLVDVDGLVTSDQPGLTEAQRSFAHDPANSADWELAQPGRPRLLDVVRNAKPTALLGVSGQPGTFDEAVCRAMTRNTARPAIMPLSNPTSRAEATPQQILDWTNGAALVGTGSPFAPVERHGTTIAINQAKNAFAFPGIGLGALAVGARRLSDASFMAAASDRPGLARLERSELTTPAARQRNRGDQSARRDGGGTTARRGWRRARPFRRRDRASTRGATVGAALPLSGRTAAALDEGRAVRKGHPKRGDPGEHDREMNDEIDARAMHRLRRRLRGRARPANRRVRSACDGAGSRVERRNRLAARGLPGGIVADEGPVEVGERSARATMP